jgi:hypothetical protein
MNRYLLLFLLFFSHSILADDSEYDFGSKILSIPTVIIGSGLLYEVRLKLNPEGLFSIESYQQTNENQTSTDQPLLIRGSGTVINILAEDTEGSQHQKFILELISEQTLLISHNIDLAPRIDSLEEGDKVDFYGEYVWNSQGGLVHWTHHDPDGQHENGWLKHKNIIY